MSVDSLGAYLRRAREERGITLEQVASGTKVSLRVLDAIEGNRYSDLPAKPFVRGFVSSYARFLGLDTRDLLTQFGGYLEERTQERLVRDLGHKGYAFERKETQSRTFLWVALSSFGLVGAVVILVLKPAIKHRRTAQVEQLQASQVVGDRGTAALTGPVASSAGESQGLVAPSAATAVSAVPVATVATSIPPATDTTAEDPMQKGDTLKPEQIHHKVTLKALEDVNIRYQTDGRKVMSFKLKKDLVLVLKAAEVALLEVSNPNAVAIRYRDRVYKTVSAFSREPASAVLRRAARSGLTFVFPSEAKPQYEDAFAGHKALASTPDPTGQSPVVQ